MFATFQTKRYFIQNETSSKKIIFQSIQEAVKKTLENFVSPSAFFFKFRWLCQLKFVPLYSVRVVFVHHSNTI